MLYDTVSVYSLQNLDFKKLHNNGVVRVMYTKRTEKLESRTRDFTCVRKVFFDY